VTSNLKVQNFRQGHEELFREADFRDGFFSGASAGKCIENAHTTLIERVFHVHSGSSL
jgi:hypothetical protein